MHPTALHHFHRSWTGICTLIVAAPCAGLWCVTRQ